VSFFHRQDVAKVFFVKAASSWRHVKASHWAFYGELVLVERRRAPLSRIFTGYDWPMVMVLCG
jgi:hypothetical protein